MSIRRLRAGDAPAYRELMLQAYGLHPQAFTSSVSERATMPMNWWESRLTSRFDVVLGAFVEDELAGIVGLALEPRQKARHKATLFGMYVVDAHRHHGLGQQLLEAALDEARRHTFLHLVQLTVTAGNDPALKLYQRCGFVLYGLEPMAIRVDDEYFDKIHMWREL
ncbi:GNAT family N-acetyltransferase [Pseudomonas corrugata]|uniref:GNAT family N-acetyltransferase n=1 Tax=Pseudomonas corrugata TaxID=47879 RepID=UPI0006D8A69E|nr:GNAT family N-acetyltransferase [Pseudomonas corrugata]AOE61991.1 GNAT family acetyltransferase [Pseudomonas corrugata]UZD94309.1 GNAT family N-acetyltransferase [Pseudomonas corrugata]UZE05208.1 GNAT family N-acetyltransferase [Pseudomonas corrugata]